MTSNDRSQALEKIKTILDEYRVTDAIICLRDAEGASLTPIVQDIESPEFGKYILETVTMMLDKILGIDIEKIVEFYRANSILAETTEQPNDAKD
jgi:hypothetical protein